MQSLRDLGLNLHSASINIHSLREFFGGGWIVTIFLNFKLLMFNVKVLMPQTLDLLNEYT
jgi:hypothetical protein